jgi:hypothetical protein
MSGFDNRKNISYIADAPSFCAVITPGTAVQTASLTYKAGWKPGPPSVTTSTMDQLMAQLLKLDSACKFYKRGAEAGTLSAADAKALEAMRLDVARTSDAQYRSACRAFGQKPQPRPAGNSVTVANAANRPQGIPALRASSEAWMAFEQAHAELFQLPYGLLNLNVIENWFADEKVQWTADTLAQCFAELKAANCFRTAATLTRGINGSLQIVQPYSHERILQLRNRQVVAQQNAAPANLSDVDRAAWDAVRAKYPQLPVNSAGFKKCCADTLVLWARTHAIETNPAHEPRDTRGDSAALRQATDRILMQWARQSNSNIGQPNSKAQTKIWLG